MIARVVAWSARHHRVVILAALLAALGGELARRRLPRDVIPDVSDAQIVLVAEWMGHPAAEVAAEVTTRLTRALDAVPGATAVRGSSMAGSCMKLAPLWMMESRRGRRLPWCT